MGQVAAKLSDQVIVTSDNPRSEALTQIFSDMQAGVTAPAKISWTEDRRRAISLALDTARGRLPLIAMEVFARVAGVIATIEVAQTFLNTGGTPIEATYIFPLPDRAAVQTLPDRRVAWRRNPCAAD